MASSGANDVLTHQVKAGDDSDLVNVRDALERLIPLLRATLGTRPLLYEVEALALPVNKGASLSLLVSELVSNAVKHGAGGVEVSLRRQGGSVRLEVCDDGPGFPDGFDPAKAANTGLELILSPARHDLRGDIRFGTRAGGGARVSAAFSIDGAGEEA